MYNRYYVWTREGGETLYTKLSDETLHIKGILVDSLKRFFNLPSLYVYYEENCRIW